MRRAMIDYGNARVAAMRSRLLSGADLRRLGEAGSPAALAGLLEHHDDWRPIFRTVAPIGADPLAVVEAAIERHRSARLGALPRFYEPPHRGLVAAVVASLDLERVVALVRRRRVGAAPDELGTTLIAGALLGQSELGLLARAPNLAELARALARFGLVDRTDLPEILAAANPARPPERFEAAIADAFDRARDRWVAGPGDDAAFVRSVLSGERRGRAAAAAELRATGAASAALLERGATLARLDALARTGRRDPLGIGPVVGYAAAVEAGAIRLRAILARVAGGWSEQRLGSYLALGGRG
jgi:vacuolar-type H+-ATPase subunit C/Vma6